MSGIFEISPNTFSTADVAQRILITPEPEQFLLRNFFGTERYFSGRFLEVDTMYRRRVLSPVVSRYHPGIVVKRPAVKTQVYDVPKLAPFQDELGTYCLPSVDYPS